MRRLYRHSEIFFFLVLLAGLVGLFSGMSEHFWSPQTFQTIANRIPPLAFAALGMTFVLIAGGIDLSVGSVSALAGTMFGWCVVDLGFSPWLGVLAGLSAGVLSGCINGLLVNILKMPSFIATLGLLEIARGLAYLITNSQTKYLGERLTFLQAPLFGTSVSFAFLLAVIFTIVAHVIVTQTIFGRHLIAVGTNPEAARLAGVSSKKVRAYAFGISGALAALGGLCHISHLGAADPNAGSGLELSAIAAAVIGGTSLSGGRGSMLMTLIGVLIIATLEAGLAQIGASEPVKRVVTGLVIIGAVAAEAGRARWARPRRRVE